MSPFLHKLLPCARAAIRRLFFDHQRLWLCLPGRAAPSLWALGLEAPSACPMMGCTCKMMHSGQPVPLPLLPWPPGEKNTFIRAVHSNPRLLRDAAAAAGAPGEQPTASTVCPASRAPYSFKRRSQAASAGLARALVPKSAPAGVFVLPRATHPYPRPSSL